MDYIFQTKVISTFDCENKQHVI